MSKKIKKLIAILVVSIILLLLLLMLLFCSFKPQIEHRGSFADNFVTAKFFWQIVNDVNKSKNSLETKKLTIKQDEVMPIIHSIENNKNLYNQIMKRPIIVGSANVNYAGDRFVIDHVLKEFFGSLCIMVRCEFGVYLSNGNLEILIDECHIGRLSLNRFFREKIAKKVKLKLKSYILYDDFISVFKEIDIRSNGDIHAVYYPYELKRFLKKYNLSF